MLERRIMGSLAMILGLHVSGPQAVWSQVRARPPARAIPTDSVRSLAPAYGTTDTTKVVSAPLTLREIIQRCVEGERSKLSGHRDMNYTLTIRTLMRWKRRKEVGDVVQRRFTDSDGFSRTVPVAETIRRFKLEEGTWVDDPDPGKSRRPVRLRSESAHYNDFEEMPFFLESFHEFDFELLERTVEVDHVIFKIAFEPKSSFKALPSGVVYVDTDDYRIIHEEFEFKQNPFPLFLTEVKRLSRHWERLASGEWIFTRILLEVDMRGGWLGVMPEHVAVALYRDQFEFDTGYDVRVFGKR